MTTNDVKQFSFSWKYGDFEIRSAKSLTGKPYVDLVKWNADHKTCIVLASYHWLKGESGEWCFVGDRPFREISEIDIACIWKQMWLTGELFSDWYEKEYLNFYE